MAFKEILSRHTREVEHEIEEKGIAHSKPLFLHGKPKWPILPTITAAGRLNKKKITGDNRQNAGDLNISAKYGGMNVFGLNKHGMSRAVRFFTEKPKSQPFTVCFYFPGTFLSHSQVYHAVKDKLYYIKNSRVACVQFEDLNVLLGTRGLENRWLVTLNSVDARDELLRSGLYLYGRKVPMKKYDEILKEEYANFLKYRQIKNSLHLNVGPLREGTSGSDSDSDSDLSDSEQHTRIIGLDSDDHDQ